MDTPQQEYYRIDLIGDSCTDVYHYGTCNRLSPEAPVPVLKETRRVVQRGMSWNVRLNMEAFGALVVHYTNEEKITKHRFIDKRYNQHLLRWDEGENEPIKNLNPALIRSNIIPDAVVISDYNKGFLSKETCVEIINYYRTLNKDIPIFVDTKKTDLSCFKDVFIKINEKEFNNIETPPNNSELIVTLGEKGTRYKDELYPTKAVEVFDVCGAGDVFLASLVYTYLRDKSMVDAINYANRMASLSVTHMGTYVLTEDDIKKISRETYDLRF
jgi:D-beta-D-heptose 7-phosphate kinase/D-beta-D-heptose 1-phosphate adenosyltransferase